MANADNTVNLQIATAYDGSGATAAQQGIAAVGTAGQSAGQEAGAALEQTASQAQKTVVSLTRVAPSGQSAGRAVAAGADSAASALQGEATAANRASTALDQVGKAGQQAGERAATGAGKATAQLEGLLSNSQSLLAGAAGGVGVAAAQQAIATLSSYVDRLKAAVQTGISFNATVESSQLSIAAILRQFQPDRFPDVRSAFGKSSEVIEDLKVKATETTATFEDLVRAFSATAGVATAAGIPIEKQAGLVVLLSNAAAGLGVSQDQLAQETRALLTGQIDENAAIARNLGITREQVEAQKAQGKLYDFLTTRLGSFSEAGKLAATTYAGLVSKLGDIATQLAGEFTAGSFGPLKEGLSSVTSFLQDPATRAGARELGAEIGVVTKGVIDLGIAAINAKGHRHHHPHHRADPGPAYPAHRRRWGRGRGRHWRRRRPAGQRPGNLRRRAAARPQPGGYLARRPGPARSDVHGGQRGAGGKHPDRDPGGPAR